MKKIVFFTLLLLVSGINSGKCYAASELKAQIPFEFIDGSIILNIRINDNARPLKLLFDTGANGIAVDQHLADSLNLQSDFDKTTSVVGGSRRISISGNNTIHLADNLSLKNQNIAIFDNGSSRPGYDGIIGLNPAYYYIINVDFNKQIISFYSFGDYAFESEGELLDITVPGGIIVVPAKLDLIGKKTITGEFVFDTGANYHLIAFEQFVRKNRLLLSGFKPERESQTVSMGVSTPTYDGKAHSFSIGESITLEQMPVCLQASSGRNTGESKISDGSIGINLIKNFNFTIDLIRKKIHLKPN